MKYYMLRTDNNEVSYAQSGRISYTIVRAYDNIISIFKNIGELNLSIYSEVKEISKNDFETKARDAFNLTINETH